MAKIASPTPASCLGVRVSLKSIRPNRTANTKLNNVNTTIALDSDSYQSEYAQNTLPAKYKASPKITSAVLFVSDQCFSTTSPATSRTAPAAISMMKIVLGDTH